MTACDQSEPATMANATTTDLFTEHVGNCKSNSEPATMAHSILHNALMARAWNTLRAGYQRVLKWTLQCNCRNTINMVGIRQFLSSQVRQDPWIVSHADMAFQRGG